MHAARLAEFRNRTHRLRLPVPPPAARVHRARERDDAGADPGVAAREGDARARDAPRPRRASHRARRTGRASCRAASSSASRWRARWCSSRAAARRRADRQPRLARPARRSTSCSSSSTGSAASTLLVVTHNPDFAALMPRRLRMVDGGCSSKTMANAIAGAVRSASVCAARVALPSARRRRVSAHARPFGAASRRRAPRARRRRASVDGPRHRQRVQFRGNRKVEDDAIRVSSCRSRARCRSEKLREDLRAMWKMGFFADIDVESERVERHGRPDVRGQGEAVDPQGLRRRQRRGRPRKINEVLDLELDTIVDISKVKRNREKIADLYVQKGFYLATVDWEIKRQRGRGRRLVQDRREGQGQDPRGPVHRQQHISDDELRGAMATPAGGWLSFLNDSGMYSQEAFERDLLLVTAHYWDRGYANVKVGTPQLGCRATSSTCTCRSRSTRAPSSRSARSTSRAT